MADWAGMSCEDWAEMECADWAGLACACSRCLACSEEEIEGLAIDVTTTGIVSAPINGCNCVGFNGTWHLTFSEFQEDPKRCIFSGEFEVEYCDVTCTLKFTVSVGCSATGAHTIDILIDIDGASASFGSMDTDGELPCDFEDIDMTGVMEWGNLCNVNDATVNLSAA